MLAISRKSINVLGTSGDDHLGGADFDYRVYQLLKERCLEKKTDRTSKSRLIMLAEHVKKRLTDSEEVVISEADVPKTEDLESETEHPCLGKRVSRSDFYTAAEDLFERALKPVDRLLADQMMSVSDVQHVVLVGGASRMPRIRAMLAARFGKEKLNTEIDPDVTVAVGAANVDL